MHGGRPFYPNLGVGGLVLRPEIAFSLSKGLKELLRLILPKESEAEKSYNRCEYVSRYALSNLHREFFCLIPEQLRRFSSRAILLRKNEAHEQVLCACAGSVAVVCSGKLVRAWEAAKCLLHLVCI